MPSETIPDLVTPTQPCVHCGAAADPQHAPFCSQGCRDRDLLQWLSDGHRIPGPAADEDGLDSHADAP